MVTKGTKYMSQNKRPMRPYKANHRKERRMLPHKTTWWMNVYSEITKCNSKIKIKKKIALKTLQSLLKTSGLSKSRGRYNSRWQWGLDFSCAPIHFWSEFLPMKLYISRRWYQWNNLTTLPIAWVKFARDLNFQGTTGQNSPQRLLRLAFALLVFTIFL